MRYMLAYMLEGEAKEYHNDLGNRLAEKFALTPASLHNDPHITLKAPFESRDVSDVTATVHAFAMTENSGSFSFAGYGDFGGRVIYWAVEAPPETVQLVKDFQDQLRTVPGLTFSPHEEPITLHTSLCFPKDPDQAKEILAYLESEKPTPFELSLDTISLLDKTERRWKVARVFKLLNEKVASLDV